MNLEQRLSKLEEDLKTQSKHEIILPLETCVFCSTNSADWIESNPGVIADEIIRLYYESDKDRKIPRSHDVEHCIHNDDEWLVKDGKQIESFLERTIHHTCRYEPDKIIQLLADFEKMDEAFLNYSVWIKNILEENANLVFGKGILSTRKITMKEIREATAKTIESKNNSGEYVRILLQEYDKNISDRDVNFIIRSMNDLIRIYNLPFRMKAAGEILTVLGREKILAINLSMLKPHGGLVCQM